MFFALSRARIVLTLDTFGIYLLNATTYFYYKIGYYVVFVCTKMHLSVFFTNKMHLINSCTNILHCRQLQLLAFIYLFFIHFFMFGGLRTFFFYCVRI